MIQVQEQVIVHRYTEKKFEVKAPYLSNLVKILFEEISEPENMSLRIQKALLAKEKQTTCFRCHEELTLEGYQLTKTNYATKEVLDCQECPTRYLISEEIFS